MQRLDPTSTMTLITSGADFDDDGNSNWIEAAIDQFEVTDSLATQLNDLNAIGQLTAFPNPFHDHGIISWNDVPENSQLEVTDVLGNLLSRYEISLSGKQVIGESLPAGIYFVKLIADENILNVIKVVKAK